MGARLSPPCVHSRTAGPAQQGHHPTYPRTRETLWSDSSLDRRDWDENLHDLHNRDVDHRDQQLRNVCGPTNSLDHGKLPLRHDGKMNDLWNCNWGISMVCLSSKDHGNRPRHHLEEALLVHTGHDAEHLRPNDDRRKHSTRRILTSKTSQAHAAAGLVGWLVGWVWV